MNIISIENVSFNYVGKPVLKNLSLYLELGQSLVITGESGTGKSTLLNLIMGYLKCKIGSVKVFGIEMRNAHDYTICKIRRLIGVITQANNLLKDINVLENITLPMLISGWEEADAIRKASKILEDVGLKGYEEKAIFELSGGEQKRVAVARALARKPRLIIADEATSGLDLENADNILNLCLELVQKRKAALIWTTHDRRSEHLFDRQLVLTKIEA